MTSKIVEVKAFSHYVDFSDAKSVAELQAECVRRTKEYLEDRYDRVAAAVKQDAEPIALEIWGMLLGMAGISGGPLPLMLAREWGVVIQDAEAELSSLLESYPNINA